MPLGWLVGNGEAARSGASQRGYRCICIGHEVAVLRNALTHEFADRDERVDRPHPESPARYDVA